MPQKNSQTEIESGVKAFLEKETGLRIAGRNADLLKKGVISSLTMFALIDFIEKKFKAQVAVADLNPENFNSLAAIAKQVRVWMSK